MKKRAVDSITVGPIDQRGEAEFGFEVGDGLMLAPDDAV